MLSPLPKKPAKSHIEDNALHMRTLDAAEQEC